jgi:hypothetical protein
LDCHRITLYEDMLIPSNEVLNCHLTPKRLWPKFSLQQWLPQMHWITCASYADTCRMISSMTRILKSAYAYFNAFAMSSVYPDSS